MHQYHSLSAERAGTAASLVSIAVNFLLAIIKLSCGILCASGALISDAIHSTADLSGTVIVLIGLRLSERSPDKHHPYGHERFECLASILLSGILAVTGVLIGRNALIGILSGAYLLSAPPGTAAAAVAALSIAAKLALSRYMSGIARRIRSTALRADAIHQITDALASLGALCGIVLSLFGFGVFEPLASLLIALFLMKAALGIFRESASRLIDRAADDETEACLRSAMTRVEGVVSVEQLRTRLFGTRIYVEAALVLDASLTLSECAPILTRARESILSASPEVKGCTVTVLPQELSVTERSGLRQDS